MSPGWTLHGSRVDAVGEGRPPASEDSPNVDRRLGGEATIACRYQAGLVGGPVCQGRGGVAMGRAGLEAAAAPPNPAHALVRSQQPPGPLAKAKWGGDPWAVLKSFFLLSFRNSSHALRQKPSIAVLDSHQSAEPEHDWDAVRQS